MDFWVGLQIYGIIAGALAGTSYINLFRPTMKLLKEILEDEIPPHDSWFGHLIWLIVSFILAPVTAFILLSNNNDLFIEKLAIALSEGLIEEDE